jgi:hypothetical protein
MTDHSKRILISCLIISVVACACLGIISIAGAVVWIYTAEPSTSGSPTQIPGVIPRPTATTQVLEQTPPVASPTPLAVDADPATPLPPIIEEVPAQIASQMDEIERHVVEIRGLEPLEPVARYLLSPEQLRQRVLDDFLSDYSAEEAQDDAIELAAFGLLNKDYDLYQLFLDLYSEQIAGFYDDDDKAMYVIQADGFMGTQRMTYAHEFVHALQDQHYNFDEGLNYNSDACEEDTERCAAIQALIEGDASFVELEWFFNYATSQDRNEIRQFYTEYQSPVFDATPSFLRESFIFPYSAGLEFVEYLYDMNGWATIEAAYRNPPVSTEQIMHPERYPDDTPIPVNLPDLLPILGNGWREISRNVMGELYTYLILAHGENVQARLTEGEARAAAQGWGGDQYLVYYNDASQNTVMVMQTIWDTQPDANLFSQAFQNHTTSRFGAGSVAESDEWIWQHQEGSTMFSISGNQTTWIFSNDPAYLLPIRDAIQLP